MSDDEFELVRGSENVFRDFGEPSAELLQLKAILAGKIISVLDQQHISVRQAHDLTGFAAADFSRVRQAKLQRFTVDRLMEMLDCGKETLRLQFFRGDVSRLREVVVRVAPRRAEAA